MKKKDLKKEIRRQNKIIDVLLKEKRRVIPEIKPEKAVKSSDYIGGRPNDRIV